VRHLESVELNRFGIIRVTDELQGFILSLLPIEEKYISPYVVYPPEGYTYFHDILLYQDYAVKLVVDKAILSG